MSRSGIRRADGWVWNPAGPDEQLALACKNLEAGRFGMARDALGECRGDFAARSRRSALLASVAAAGDAVDHWLAEEPGNLDALLLAARTAVVRAHRAAGRASASSEAGQRARRLCLAAARAYPTDPTPWVAQLALARTVGNTHLTLAEGRKLYEEQNAQRGQGDTARHAAAPSWAWQLAEALGGSPQPPKAPRRPYWPVHQMAAELEELLAQGPWDLMFEVWARDLLGREGYRWMLDCLAVHDAVQFAQVVSLGTPPTAATALLPLVAALAQYRWLSASGPAAAVEGGAAGVWRSQALRATCLDVFDGWFTATRRGGGPIPVADYSLLAHALYRVGERHFAARVLEALKPFASTYPWSVTGGDGEREFLRVAQELGVSPPRALSGWEYRELYG